MARVSKRRNQPQSNEPSWWKKPEWIVLLLALGVAIAGWALVIQARSTIPVRQADLYGLEARLNQARWLVDQMDHGEGFARPATMMPDMPDPGSQRLSVELSFRNQSDQALEYRGEEFVLVSDAGNEYPPIGAQLGEFTLSAGHSLNTSIYYDFDSSRDLGNLKLRWVRGDETVYMPIPHPPEHYHLRPQDRFWPDDVMLLMPISNAERGRNHFMAAYGCSACHGDPSVPGSNNVGPHLAGIGREGAGRLPGKSAAQYIYESILRPEDFIASECKNGPCSSPSAMPDYTGILDEQAMADLVAYLLTLSGE